MIALVSASLLLGRLLLAVFGVVGVVAFDPTNGLLPAAVGESAPFRGLCTTVFVLEDPDKPALGVAEISAAVVVVVVVVVVVGAFELTDAAAVEPRTPGDPPPKIRNSPYSLPAEEETAVLALPGAPLLAMVLDD
jgi:hypothetical protein